MGMGKRATAEDGIEAAFERALRAAMREDARAAKRAKAPVNVPPPAEAQS